MVDHVLVPALRVLVPAVCVAALAAGQVSFAVAGSLAAATPAGPAAIAAAAVTAAPTMSGSSAAPSGSAGSLAAAVSVPPATGHPGDAANAVPRSGREQAAKRPSRDAGRGHPPVALPVRAGTPISGEFGEFGSHWPTGHGGMDFNGETGDPIYAATNGRVIHADFNYGGFGNLVMIKRGDGVQTWYAHLDSFAVRAGERVRAGELIGRMGSTGDSTGAHLHFEVRVGSVPTPTDPRSLLFGPRRGHAAKPPAWACSKWGC